MNGMLRHGWEWLDWGCRAMARRGLARRASWLAQVWHGQARGGEAGNAARQGWAVRGVVCNGSVWIAGAWKGVARSCSARHVTVGTGEQRGQRWRWHGDVRSSVARMGMQRGSTWLAQACYGHVRRGLAGNVVLCGLVRQSGVRQDVERRATRLGVLWHCKASLAMLRRGLLRHGERRRGFPAAVLISSPSYASLSV